MVYCKKDQKRILIFHGGEEDEKCTGLCEGLQQTENEINKGTYPVGGFLPKEVNWRKSIRSAVLRYGMQ